MKSTSEFMLYNLPNGKTISLTLDEYLNLTDEEIQFLVAYGYGENINNPQSGSILGSLSREKMFKEHDNDDGPTEDELDELSAEDILNDLDVEEDY